MTKVSILFDIIRWEEKALYEAGKKLGLDVEMVDVKEKAFNLSKDCGIEFGDIALQRSVSYYRNLHTTAYLEYKGVRVINSLHTAIVTGNKMFTTLVLQKNNIPTPKTIVTFTSDAAMKVFREEFNGKAVLKPVSGSWGRMVALLNDEAAAQAVLEDRDYMYPMYQVFYMQEYVNRPPRDLRIFVVGEEVITGIYRYQPQDDWRTNTARGGRAVKCEITEEIRELALKAAEAVGGGVFGVDMMESPHGLIVHEVNNTTEFKNTVPATGVDIPKIIMEYAMKEARR
ncbi:MAG: lysine biosynthesis protein LysX [Nitrososphaeria archaeon]|nr:lysine biosynthesis protein LysX [Nitrososphaeria archaeon]